MKCSYCSNNATTHLRQNINGQSTELWLCPDCAEKMGIGGMFSDLGGFGSFGSFDGLFSSLMGGADSLLSSFFGGTRSLPSETRCSVCGSSFSDIAERGKAGCANCYETFAAQLRPTIERIHGRTVHTGKLPGKSSPASKSSGQNKQEASAAKPAGPGIDELRSQLKKAIDAEEYEQAAALRDRIRELEGK